jgi:hypothetical protein
LLRRVRRLDEKFAPPVNQPSDQCHHKPPSAFANSCLFSLLVALVAFLCLSTVYLNTPHIHPPTAFLYA